MVVFPPLAVDQSKPLMDTFTLVEPNKLYKIFRHNALHYWKLFLYLPLKATALEPSSVFANQQFCFSAQGTSTIMVETDLQQRQVSSFAYRSAVIGPQELIPLGTNTCVWQDYSSPNNSGVGRPDPYQKDLPRKNMCAKSRVLKLISSWLPILSRLGAPPPGPDGWRPTSATMMLGKSKGRVEKVANSPG